MIELTDKIAAYANALDSDIDAELFEQVRGRKLWRGWIGTIYGAGVDTDAGYAFGTKCEAVENARLMREQCREIWRKATGGTPESAEVAAMNMNEDRCQVEGTNYITRAADARNSHCSGCAAFDRQLLAAEGIRLCRALGSCCASYRQDGRNVHWIKEQPEQI